MTHSVTEHQELALNTLMKMRLLPQGAKILHDYLENHFVSIQDKAHYLGAYSIKSDGYVYLPLWEVMNIFGPHIATNYDIFERNSLVIV